jgi:hypothetical protein
MMAGRIDHMLFWAGGVILPRLSSLAAHALPASPGPLGGAPGPLGGAGAGGAGGAAGTDPAVARRLADLERRLAQGEFAPPVFCELAAAAAGAPGMGGALEQAMLAGAGILPGMAGLLEDLAPRARLGLLSDYPRPWLQAIMDRSELARIFSPANIQYTADRPGADLFDALTAEGVIRPGSTLWVDYDSPRAMIAVRRGIDAALCVDARRLRRDLGLWGLVPMAPA